MNHRVFWFQILLRWRKLLTLYCIAVVAGLLFFCMSNGGDLFLYTKYGSSARLWIAWERYCPRPAIR
jgi:hypothetical protein